MYFLRKIDSFLGKFSIVFLYISSIALFLMGFLCFLDVIMRYFFNSPIKGAQEIIQIAMVVFVFFGLGQAARGGKFVRVPLFLEKMGCRLNAGFKAFASLCGIFASILFSRQLMINSMSYMGNLSMITPEVGVPYWILYLICSIGSIIMGVELLARFIREIFIVVGLDKKFEELEKKENENKQLLENDSITVKDKKEITVEKKGGEL